MTLLERIQQTKTLWATVMPQGISLPDDHTFFLWVSYHSEQDVELAVTKAGKRMSKNLRQGISFDGPDAAARYCSSVLGNLAASRKNTEVGVKSATRGVDACD
jgi:hypothetical protein